MRVPPAEEPQSFTQRNSALVSTSYDYNYRLQPVRIQPGTSASPAANYCTVYNYYSATPTTSCTVPGTTGADNSNAGNAQTFLWMRDKQGVPWIWD